MEQIQGVLTDEDELALLITGRFWGLSGLAKHSLRIGEPVDFVRQRVEDCRDALNTERRRLMQQELELYETV